MPLPKNGFVVLTGKLPVFLAFTLLVLMARVSPAQTTRGDGPYYGRKNSFGGFAGYSWDSSHVLLGDAERRKLVNLGVSYSRRLVLNRRVDWMYSAELLPVALESDPLTESINRQTSPSNATYVFTLQNAPVTCAVTTIPYSVTNPETGITVVGKETYFCHGRQWTIGEAVSPFGFQWNFLPRHKLQPFVDGHGGYMYSTRPIPVGGARGRSTTHSMWAQVWSSTARAGSPFALSTAITTFRTTTRPTRIPGLTMGCCS
jgi:hypothetical protein